MPSRLTSSTMLAAALALWACGDEETGAAGPPPKTIAEQTCEDLSARVAGCGEASACEKALAHDCAAVAGMLGDPYLGALKGCLDERKDLASCAVEAGAGLTPSDAQHAFAESFCKNCAIGIPGCVDVLFGGKNAELAPVASLIAPLSDSLVGEITQECTNGITCLATFQSCVEGVLAKRALPKETIGCFVGMVLGQGQGSSECGQGGAGSGAGGAGGAGGADGGAGGVPTGAGGQGGGMCSGDPSEPNDDAPTAKELFGGGDGILSDCEGDETGSGVLATAGDADWFRYHGSDGPCGLDSIQPHATVDAPGIQVCVYVDPAGDSAAPTCLTGTPATLGPTLAGCCGEGAARLAFGSNLANDDAEVYISLSTKADVCIDYEVTYGFGDG